MRRRDFAATALGAIGCACTGERPSVSPAPGDSAARVSPPEPDTIVRGDEFHRGVNYTAEWPDRYESERAREILRSLPDYGIDSVGLVPYGLCRKGDPEIRFSGRRSWERDDALARLTDIAHEAGMRVLLKPQIWVPRAFPGELEFSTDTDTRKWFEGYEGFLEHYARLASRTNAELFSVGVEFSQLIRYEERWRRLIELARGWYPGKLVYSANWGREFESIAFWDALDFIGLNNYYPLPDDLSTDTVVAKVTEVHQRFDRPVLFPETGFPSLTEPHREPWAEHPRAISLEDQARCYEAVLSAFYPQPWCAGMYWWKIGTNGFGGPQDGSHTPWRKPAMDVMTRWYLRGREGREIAAAKSSP